MTRKEGEPKKRKRVEKRTPETETETVTVGGVQRKEETTAASKMVSVEEEATLEVQNDDYEAYWEKLKAENPKLYWSPDLRKSFLMIGIEFIVAAHEKHYDTMVFMDRSARPLAGFFLALWRRLYPNETPPNMKFMLGGGYAASIDPQELARRFPKESFAGKSVLLVDEQIATGEGVENAKNVLMTAFRDNPPTIKFGTLNMGSPVLIENRADIEIIVGGIKLSTAMHRAEKPIEKRRGDAFAKPTKKNSPPHTFSHRLRQVGKFETLNQDDVNQKIDRELEYTTNEEERVRLDKLRKTYFKFVKS